MSKAPRSIAVLVSAGRHPVSGAARVCRGDAVAVALGRRLGGECVRVIHAGSAEEPSLRDYLALGANRIEVLAMREGQDAVQPLAAHLKTVDIILTGSRAETGAGSGMLPYNLARALGRPIVANVLDAEPDDGGLAIRQFLPKGRRRGIDSPLPIVLAVYPLAPVELNYAYARRLAGKIDVTGALMAPSSEGASVWTVEPALKHPVRLRAQETKTGHARLQSAITSEAKGGVVAFEGSPVDKAQIMLNYLREHRLVDF